MRVLIYLLMVLMGYSSSGVGAILEVDARNQVSAGRLNEARRNLPATLVIRHNSETGAVDVLRSTEVLGANASTVSTIANRNFVGVETNKPIRGELDRDTSRSNWFYIGFGRPYFYGYGYNNFYYGNYSPYYNNYGYYPYYPTYSYNNFYYPYYGYYNYLSYPYNYYFYRWRW
ncbi:MAG: hypothetical protein A4S09_13630 [Proteobacteria bacterium SG_bin7]|nr:MAG: hypothetical protein A4S09_13630 [Proteobacteria bacterium SG_bin7]